MILTSIASALSFGRTAKAVMTTLWAFIVTWASLSYACFGSFQWLLDGS
jgi:hypothetical protein